MSGSSLQNPAHAATAPEPTDDTVDAEPSDLELPPLDDDGGADGQIDAGPDEVDARLDGDVATADDEPSARGDDDGGVDIIGDEPSAADDDAPSLADEPLDDDEIVAGDEHGLLKDSDEPDGRDTDAAEAGIDVGEESSLDDGGAEGPKEATDRWLDDEATDLWDRLDPATRAALRAALGSRVLAAIATEAGAVYAALVDDERDRCVVVAVAGGAVRTLADLDVAGEGDVRAIALDAHGAVVVTLARGAHTVAIDETPR
jgi:hypothetical protein